MSPVVEAAGEPSTGSAPAPAPAPASTRPGPSRYHNKRKARSQERRPGWFLHKSCPIGADANRTTLIGQRRVVSAVPSRLTPRRSAPVDVSVSWRRRASLGVSVTRRHPRHGAGRHARCDKSNIYLHRDARAEAAWACRALMSRVATPRRHPRPRRRPPIAPAPAAVPPRCDVIGGICI